MSFLLVLNTGKRWGNNGDSSGSGEIRAGIRGRDVKRTEGRDAKKLSMDPKDTEFTKEGLSFQL